MGFSLVACLAVFLGRGAGSKDCMGRCAVLLCIGEVCLMLMHNSFACGLVCICEVMHRTAHVASWSGTCAVWCIFFFTMFCCDICVVFNVQY